MTLRVLGAGAAFSRRYGTTCSVLTLPAGHRWLIDCGRQAPEQLQDAGIDWHSLQGQMVTHVHGDHVFGLEEFALVRYYNSGAGEPAIAAGGAKPKLFAHSAVLSELWEVLGPSLRYRSDSAGRPVSGCLQDYFDVSKPIRVEEPRQARWNHSETFEESSLTVTVRETQHVQGKPSTSIELVLPGDNGRVAWWSGDAVVDSELLEEIAPRTSIFFHDCTFSSSLGGVHGAFEELARLPENVRRRMVLMHHEDDIEGQRDIVEALGFRICMPGDVYDLSTGTRSRQG